MPYFRLTDELIFPPPEMACEDGLLAVGGDLSPERLILAYRMGIFPWYSEDSPILWWSPDPRLVLFPGELHLSKSLRKTIKHGAFQLSMDESFCEVVDYCASVPRPDQDGTWILTEMAGAYKKLHSMGYAHSVECRQDGKLVGGLYGISLGDCFFGESMFSLIPDASKVALYELCRTLVKWDFSLIDCQVTTEHLTRLGAKEMSREAFLRIVKEGLKKETRSGKWDPV